MEHIIHFFKAMTAHVELQCHFNLFNKVVEVMWEHTWCSLSDGTLLGRGEGGGVGIKFWKVLPLRGRQVTPPWTLPPPFVNPSIQVAINAWRRKKM